MTHTGYMNTMTAKTLTQDLFEAHHRAGSPLAFAPAPRIAAWVTDVMGELIDGDLTPEQVALEIAALED